MRQKPDFEQEVDRLQRRLPGWMQSVLESVRRPGAVWLRVPAALALTAGGFVGFLPILGFWMVPLGLALLAFDLPFLRRPLARLLAFINRKLGGRTRGTAS
jgi:hypothetical protein